MFALRATAGRLSVANRGRDPLRIDQLARNHAEGGKPNVEDDGAGHAHALLALREAQSLGGFRLSRSLPSPNFVYLVRNPTVDKCISFPSESPLVDIQSFNALHPCRATAKRAPVRFRSIPMTRRATTTPRWRVAWVRPKALPVR